MRLLVIRIGAMGDILHALPAVAALRSALPEAHLGWAIEPRWKPLLQSSAGESPLVSTLHPVETRLWKQHPFSLSTLRSLTGLRGALRAGAYDACIDLQGSIRSAVVGRLAHASAFFGAAHPREAPAALLYGTRVPLSATHVIDQAAELLAAAVSRPLTPAPALLPADPAAEAWWAQQTFARSPSVFLVPQAGWGAKQWPAERFGVVAQHLAHAGFRVLVNQTHRADPLTAVVIAASHGAAEPVQADLAQLIALTRRTSLVLAGDTGPTHLAAALGRPVLALFGPTDPARTGPRTPLSRVLRHPSSVTDHSRHPATEGGLLHISTAAVIQAALTLLQQTPPPEPLA